MASQPTIDTIHHPACTTSTAHRGTTAGCSVLRIASIKHCTAYTPTATQPTDNTNSRTTAARSYAQLQHKTLPTIQQSLPSCPACQQLAILGCQSTLHLTLLLHTVQPATTLNATAKPQMEHSLLHLSVHCLADCIAESSTHAGVTQRWEMLQAALLLLLLLLY